MLHSEPDTSLVFVLADLVVLAYSPHLSLFGVYVGETCQRYMPRCRTDITEGNSLMKTSLRITFGGPSEGCVESLKLRESNIDEEIFCGVIITSAASWRSSDH